MTHRDKRLFLIKRLLSESPQYRDVQIPEDEDGRKRLLRSLMNVRLPWPACPEFLEVQDEYLREEVMARGIVDGEALPASPVNRKMVLWRGDITALKVDAIVNAANGALRGCFVPCHSCVDNIIHSFSGIQLRLACNEMMEKQGHDEPAGMAKMTPAFNLPCRYVLHTVGPIVLGRLNGEDCRLLAACYTSCLKLAVEHGLRSIAFCCISTGAFHFPGEKAAKIAVETVGGFLEADAQIERVIFSVFRQEDYEIYQSLIG